MKNLTNEQLLEEYKQANLAAFEEFYRRNNKLIYNFLQIRLRNTPNTEDAFQETFFRIHKYILRYDFQQNALAWAMTIARNTAIDIHKKSAKLSEQSLEDTENIAANQTTFEASEEIESLMKLLTDDERMILKAKFLRDDSYEEISAHLKISSANARQRVSRVIKKIKSLV